MICRDKNIRRALRDKQRGFLLNPFRFGGASDPYFASVVLLLHMDGSNGSTATIDSSSSNKTMTAIGNAKLSTAQKKFGPSSALFDGNADYFSTPDSQDWNLGTGDFTVEFSYYATSFPNGGAMLGTWSVSEGQNSWLVGNPSSGQPGSPPANAIRFVASANGRYDTSTVDIYGTGPGSLMVVNTWYHIAIVRGGGSFKLFINGKLLTTKAIGSQSSNAAINIYHNNFPLKVGGIGTTTDANGYMDEVRITKGVARYSNDFFPPTGPFPDS
ncbi:LamG domain-containing protein [Comamonas aquatica]|uniref:LamG domain-containing protein n=1 Tax=Comamonas aquatica TaxID=225991 RepID=A0AA43AWV3_9BURK|nr:LamG domain-containing protein [Comamonas aquatica]MDH1429090.1 LamG domain-containing protein [Comamonas aquatica]MDH1604967.1 LamG domain-containing protein [Comamonas aquatica]MDH1615991.1 LamG domain-containing protein [Comamonas aquatica]MDH2004856.1 LamG domain-containing protein [Comamonas aquatica]